MRRVFINDRWPVFSRKDGWQIKVITSPPVQRAFPRSTKTSAAQDVRFRTDSSQSRSGKRKVTSKCGENSTAEKPDRVVAADPGKSTAAMTRTRSLEAQGQLAVEGGKEERKAAHG